MPSHVKISGRPKNVQNFTRNKRKAKAPTIFEEIPTNEKLAILRAASFNHLGLIKQCTNELNLKSSLHMGSVLLEDSCDLNILTSSMTAPIKLLFDERLYDKKAKNLYSCAQCLLEDDKIQKMICCDRCLEWYHFKCASFSEKKPPKNWFCNTCWFYL